MSDQIDAFGITDRGFKRDSNQDAFLIASLSKSMLLGSNSVQLQVGERLFGDVRGHLMLVADGMGGHAGGQRASQLAIQFLVERMLNNVHWLFESGGDDETPFIDSLQKLLRDTHQQIQSEGRRNTSLLGMGTTLTMCYIVWPCMYIAHAGDSRCYLIRRGQVEQVTTDHTLARRLVESGSMRPEEEATSRWSNVLWNVLGGKSDDALTAEVRRVDLAPNDTVLLCSDGLHRYLNGAQLLEVLDDHPSCQAACQAFIQLALDRGGDDNITAVVARMPDRRDAVRDQSTATTVDFVVRGITPGDTSKD